MKPIKAFLSRHWGELLLIAAAIGLFLANYAPGKYLTGWDNLQTELNNGLNLKRSFWSVWEEYQSFGLLAGMAHAADLMRNLMYLLLSAILPQQMVRYVFHIGCVLTGAWGMLLLLRFTLETDKRSTAAPFGALFYMLNFGSTQLFFLLFEPFSLFFAALPWSIYAWLRLLDTDHRSRRDWIFFVLVHILGSSFAVLQQLFAVYMIALGILSIVTFIKFRTPKTVLLLGVLFSLVFAIHAFWIIPQAYFLRTSGNIITEAKINQLATEQVFNENRSKGTLVDFSQFRGFYYDLTDVGRVPLFKAWQDHFNNPFITWIPFAFFGIMLLGLSRIRDRWHWFFVGLFILSCVALLNNTPPFSWLNAGIRQIAIINQIFRSPFTKFVIMYSFVGSYLFAAGLLAAKDYLRRWKPREFAPYRRYAPAVLVIGTCTTIFLYALPAFRGYFFSPLMRVEIPQRYFELMDYFHQADKNKRIALLPDYTFWGWFNHSWGYYGSGFLWYGIEQPIVSRTFDVWSPTSEGYFWEVKHAMHSNSPERLENLADKYGIDYFLFDETMLPLNKATTTKQFAKVRRLLSNSKRIKPVKHWDKLILYQVQQDIPRDTFLTTADTLPNVGPQIRMTDDDTAYNALGTYQTNPAMAYARYYPFLDLMTLTREPNRAWDIQEFPDSYQVQRELPFDPADYRYEAASPSASMLRNLSPEVRRLSISTSPTFSDNWLYVSFPKINLVNFDTRNTTVDNCGFIKNEIQARSDDKGIQVRALNSSTACFPYVAQFPKTPASFIMTVESKNWEGQRPFFYVLDGTKEESILEDRIRTNPDYFVLNHYPNIPQEFSVNFQVNSYGTLASNNEINTLKIEYFPLDILKRMYFSGPRTTTRPPIYAEPENAAKPSYYTYSVPRAEEYAGSTLVLYQSFHPGWNAYLVSGTNSNGLNAIQNGTPLTSHRRINNWANGWELPLDTPTDTTVVLVFWPQYLQYLGFIIGFASLGILGAVVVLQKRNYTKLRHHHLSTHHAHSS